MENFFQKNSSKQEIAMAFFYSRQGKRKARTFHLKGNNGKLLVEVIIVNLPLLRKEQDQKVII